MSFNKDWEQGRDIEIVAKKNIGKVELKKKKKKKGVKEEII